MMTHLGDIEAAAALTGRPIDDPRLLHELIEASRRFRAAVRRPITAVDDDRIVLDGGGRTSILLPSAPVRAVSEVLVDGTPAEVEWSTDGMMRLKSGAAFPDRLGNVEITYSHGFETIPEDIIAVITDVAVGRASTVRGLTSQQVGGISLSYGRDEQQGVTQAWVDAVERWRIRSGDRA